MDPLPAYSRTSASWRSAAGGGFLVVPNLTSASGGGPTSRLPPSALGSRSTPRTPPAKFRTDHRVPVVATRHTLSFRFVLRVRLQQVRVVGQSKMTPRAYSSSFEAGATGTPQAHCCLLLPSTFPPGSSRVTIRKRSSTRSAELLTVWALMLRPSVKVWGPLCRGSRARRLPSSARRRRSVTASSTSWAFRTACRVCPEPLLKLRGAVRSHDVSVLGLPQTVSSDDKRRHAAFSPSYLRHEIHLIPSSSRWRLRHLSP